jgi:hypothetical protein
MAYIESNFFPLKIYVRNEYLYQNKKGFSEFTEGVIISIRCLPGQAALFQVLLNNGVMRDKLPSHALLTKPEIPNPDLPFHYLQIWDCFSYNFSLIQLNYLPNAQVSVFMKNKKWIDGNYFATINWGSNDSNTNFTLAEDGMEHKCHHIVLLKNGQIALQPNNRMKWSEASFVTKPFPEKPDYLVNNQIWNCESTEKWATDDSDYMFYNNDLKN